MTLESLQSQRSHCHGIPRQLTYSEGGVQGNAASGFDDLLERYRGLVTLGRIKEDEEQIRVIMQVENFSMN